MDANELQLRAALAQKLAGLCSALGRFVKDGENASQKYRFVSYEQINAKLRDALAEHHLVFLPSVTKVEEREIATRTGSAVRSVVQGSLTVIDTTSGYSMTIGIAGGDIDTGGKSLGKAITEMVKRGEMKLLHISTKDDIDPDNFTFDGDTPPLPEYYQGGQPPRQQEGYL